VRSLTRFWQWRRLAVGGIADC